jgi:probable HAF family extracellular repeat protein
MCGSGVSRTKVAPKERRMKMDRRIRNAFVSLVVVAMLVAVLAGPSVVPRVEAQEEITITDLGTIGVYDSFAYDINDLGQAVGESRTTTGETHATLWTEVDGAWQAQDLGTLGGSSSWAYGINNLGQVVGSSWTATGEEYAFLWEDGVMTGLGTLEGGQWSIAYGINDLGQVVGDSEVATGIHAFLWEEETGTTDLGTLDVPCNCEPASFATDINNLGQVVGESTGHAFLWQEGAMTDLGTLGGQYASAHGINDLGQVVGDSVSATGVYSHTVLWEDGVISDLGTLGAWNSYGYDINNLGQVVGEGSTAAGDRAFLWEAETGMTELGTLGGMHSNAMAINDIGQVVGYSTTNSSDESHATLWTVPVPVVTPEQSIADAIEAVAALVSDGTLGGGEGNALTSKLEVAQTQLDKGNTSGCTNLLRAFINQVEAMVNSGRLTAEEAQPLIDSANAAIESIEAEP